MSQPSSRSELINYCKRQLGAPVLEINVAEEQLDDLVDDALQYYHERHFDGVVQTYLKYKITQDDIDRGRAKEKDGNVGVTTTTVSSDMPGMGTVNFSYNETGNYLQVPSSVIGITKIYHFDGANTTTNNMFSLKYQMFLNDLYYWGSMEILTYAMTKTYLEDLNFLLTTEKQIRFNQRMDRLYIDIDWSAVKEGEHLIIDCYRLLDPNEYTKVWNDSFLKRYLTALVKRQWGQNLIKFQGVKLPGGVELNGRMIYEDAQNEINFILEEMSSTYELPPLDMIG